MQSSSRVSRADKPARLLVVNGFFDLVVVSQDLGILAIVDRRRRRSNEYHAVILTARKPGLASDPAAVFLQILFSALNTPDTRLRSTHIE